MRSPYQEFPEKIIVRLVRMGIKYCPKFWNFSITSSCEFSAIEDLVTAFMEEKSRFVFKEKSERT